MNTTLNKLKPYVFPMGIGAALILGLLSTWLTPAIPFLVSLLVLAGIGVGFLNISTEETKDYIIATTALVVVTFLAGSMLGQVQLIGGLLQNVLSSILAFVTPSLIVVAIKSIIQFAKD